MPLELQLKSGQSGQFGRECVGWACGPAGQDALHYCADWGISPVPRVWTLEKEIIKFYVVKI
ncbi:MAG TPA: hypothetical protein PLP19_11015, partial [bacterium]|nr:hypothetical protein [bacterium]HPN44011.1 hypothetical protein [bacterium]